MTPVKSTLPTIHHTSFHLGRHVSAPLPTKIVDPLFPVRTAFAARRLLSTILSSSVRTLFIPRRTELWTQVSLIRTALVALPTIHRITFHIGRLAFAPLPTIIVAPHFPVRTAFATLPTIHHTIFHIGRLAFAPLPTRIVELRFPVRTAIAAARKSPRRFDLNYQIRQSRSTLRSPQLVNLRGVLT